jgi:hypothetical protein
MYQQLWGYKIEEKLHLGIREQETVSTTDLENLAVLTSHVALKTSVPEEISYSVICYIHVR